MGRPLATLSPVRQRQLERLAAGIDRYVGELDALRAEVAAVAATAAAEGADTLAALTDAQLAALGDNVFAEGRWDHVDETIRLSGGDYFGVHLPGTFVGIEKDGYTHS